MVSQGQEIFGKLMVTLYRLLYISISFGLIEAAAQYIANVAPFIVLADKYFRGSMDFGAMMEAATVLGALQGAFTTLVTQMSSITNMGAQAIRIQQLWDMLDETDLDDTGINSAVSQGVLLDLDELTIYTPRGPRPLVEKATRCCSVDPVVWARARCCGASRGFGIEEVARSTTSYAKETYLCLGSLRDNATYPKALSESPKDEEIIQALEDVNLAYLLPRYGLEAPIDFDSCLSGGERQRLGFARLLVAKPKFAVLDEATSALDSQNQEAMYCNLQRHVDGYVSVGHTASLEAFHTMKLLLERRGW
eukprot:g32136.t1